MARNPELDHEFRENKKEEKAVPFVYQDNDPVIEPFEMLAINRDCGLNTHGWKQKLLMALVVILAIVAGAWLLLGFFPWLISTLNPDLKYLVYF